MKGNKTMETNKICPNCSSYLHEETIKEIDYPLVCYECDENFYNFEAIKQKEVA
jgi:hypothetical protein